MADVPSPPAAQPLKEGHSEYRADQRYRSFGGTKAVDGVNLQASAGVLGLLGPNGAGKTSAAAHARDRAAAVVRRDPAA